MLKNYKELRETRRGGPPCLPAGRCGHPSREPAEGLLYVTYQVLGKETLHP